METDGINPADKDFQREVEILTRLARERSIKLVADQFGEDEKTISRLKSKAFNYSVRLIAEMPQIVQAYIIEMTLEKRPKLRQELDEYKAGATNPDLIAKQKHFENLAEDALKVADFLSDACWPYRCDDTTPITECIVNLEDVEFAQYMDDRTGPLFAHMQAEFPDLIFAKGFCELQVKDITREFVERLRSRAAKKEFIGACQMCP